MNEETIGVFLAFIATQQSLAIKLQIAIATNNLIEINTLVALARQTDHTMKELLKLVEK